MERTGQVCGLDVSKGLQRWDTAGPVWETGSSSMGQCFMDIGGYVVERDLSPYAKVLACQIFTSSCRLWEASRKMAYLLLER